MNRVKIGLIHSSVTLVPLFQELCSELLPGVETLNIADNSLIDETLAQGKVPSTVFSRLRSLILEAETAGAQAIMVTCSTLGPVAEAYQGVSNVPVIRVDLAMADQAVALGDRIGVVATRATTLTPTVDLIRQRAMAVNKSVEILVELCEGAFEALMNGDSLNHDRLVRERLEKLLASVDVIVLAQASMARVVAQLPHYDGSVPILTSPRLAVESLAKRFRESA
jgi:Asp/Glu/hydantoin racemase